MKEGEYRWIKPERNDGGHGAWGIVRLDEHLKGGDEVSFSRWALMPEKHWMYKDDKRHLDHNIGTVSSLSILSESLGETIDPDMAERLIKLEEDSPHTELHGRGYKDRKKDAVAN